MAVALVTGGSQGVGRGIVEGLAEAGHEVFFTGRSAERLEQTADAARALGGRVFPRCVDHGDDRQVSALFAEVGAQHELELLVNNVWGGYEKMVEDGRFTWPDPFWEQPVWRWDAMMGIGVRAAFVASQFATRLMLERSRGLIVNISFWAAKKHMGNALYGMECCRDPPQESAAFGDVLLFAVPYRVLPGLGKSLGDLRKGKVVLDACNP